jgi:hypothetical protein
VLGTLLEDEVGLGKTITTIATIGTIVHLCDVFQKEVSGPVTKRPQYLGGASSQVGTGPTHADRSQRNLGVLITSPMRRT